MARAEFVAGGVFLKYEEEIVGEGARLAGTAGGASGSEEVVKEGCEVNYVEQCVEASENASGVEIVLGSPGDN